jgi:exonuclease III
MGMRFGTWNVRSICRMVSLKTVARELGRYKLDSVGVQEVRWEKGGTGWAEDYNFFYGRENGYHQLGTGFSYVRESYQWLGERSLLVRGCCI